MWHTQTTGARVAGRLLSRIRSFICWLRCCRWAVARDLRDQRPSSELLAIHTGDLDRFRSLTPFYTYQFSNIVNIFKFLFRTLRKRVNVEYSVYPIDWDARGWSPPPKSDQMHQLHAQELSLDRRPACLSSNAVHHAPLSAPAIPVPMEHLPIINMIGSWFASIVLSS